MSGQPGMAGGGVFAAALNIATTLLASGKTRLELLGNEIEEEKLRAIHLVLMAQGMVFCFGVATLLSVGLLAAVFWESRLAVLGLSVGVFALIGAAFYLNFKRLSHRPDRVFAASIAELQEDIRQLKTALEHEQSLK